MGVGAPLAEVSITQMRILVAQRDLHLGNVLEQLLSTRGYQVLRAGHGEDVTAILETEEPPAMAIVDQGLPGGGGVKVCRRLRRARAGDTYLLMLIGLGDVQVSALSDVADTPAALAAGANDLV